MKLATWNINSVRLRINLVRDYLKDADIDVLCLQETKTEDAHFPAEALAEAGWAHHAYRGEKSYNGVAIISRLPLADQGHMDWVGRGDCRHISARVEGGPLVHNFYVPAGGDVPDRDENPKFGHKLDFIALMVTVLFAFLLIIQRGFTWGVCNLKKRKSAFIIGSHNHFDLFRCVP